MKNLLFLFFIIFILSCNNDQSTVVVRTTQNPTSEQFESDWDLCEKALKESIYPDYLKHAERAYTFSPNAPILNLLYADALLSMNQQEKAKPILESLNKLKASTTYKQLTSEQFPFIKKSDYYEHLISLALIETEPTNNSDIAYILPEKDLIPEGIAFDAKTKTLFISSINKRKIVAIDSTGRTSDFIVTGQDHILGVLGMEVDEQRRHLWVCSAWDIPRKIVPDSLLHSAIYKYNIDNGKLLNKYVLNDTVNRLLNDLTIAIDGTIYITESFKGKVYIIRPEKDVLELFIDSDHYYYANGITISDNNKYLYVCNFGGTFILDLEKNIINRLKHTDHMYTGRVDGIAYYKNSLIMHQVSSGMGVCRYFLNDANDSIISKKIIERNNPLFDFPTTGEIAGDKYFYIANAQLRRFDENGFVFPDEKMDSVYILKTTLDN